MRSTIVALAVCLASTLLMAQLPYIALLMCALVLAELALRGRPALAAFIAGATAAVTAVLWGAPGALLAVTGLVGVLVAITLLDRVDPWVVFAMLAVGYTLSFVAVDVVGAVLTGDALVESMRMTAQANSEAVIGAARIAGIDSATLESQALSETLFSLWPADYIATAIVTAAFVSSGVGRAARRRGGYDAFPALGQIDLSPHVLWLPIIGVSFLVAAELAGESLRFLTVVGRNVLVIAWPFFAWQGLATIVGKLERWDVAPPVRALVYACTAFVEILFFAVSLLGFVDIVANFRKLERVDTPPQGTAEGSASSS